MILTELDISQFRNIEHLTLHPHASLNLLDGYNGSGKSSILEAIQCLSTGHSFRTRKPKELIRRESDAYTVAGLFQDETSRRDHRAGLMRHRDGTVDFRLDYQSITSVASITRLLPVKALTPDSHKLVQDGPDERRQFLDWGLFHVEPNFLDAWRQYRRALTQRNQLLRENSPTAEIRSWDQVLLPAAMRLDQYRKAYVTQLTDALSARLSVMKPAFHVELRYRSGWSAETPLNQLLESNLDTHRKMKTTTDGPHRAELAIFSDGLLAKQVLSRGQQKVLVYLLHLSQLDLLKRNQVQQAIVLCDDLTSELDINHSHHLIEQLLELQTQLFVTGVDLDTLREFPNQRFHMEHGVAKKVV